MDELIWRKSSRSYDWKELKCVEVAPMHDGRIAFRNSKDPTGPVVIYTKDEVTAFFEGVRAGEFDDLLVAA
jgi:hypothetical protein